MSLSAGVTCITFDANGVPRIRDTGIAVWQIVSLLESNSTESLLEAFPALHPNDMMDASRYRIDELSHFLRKLSHDGISQLNSVSGFTELAYRGMIDAEEARELMANSLRGSTQTALASLTYAARVLNSTTDLVANALSFQFLLRIAGFLHELCEAIKMGGSLTVRIEGGESAPNHLYILNDDGLQSALAELFRLRYFLREFEDNCLITVTSADETTLTLVCERTVNASENPTFLFDWSLSPIPIAAYVLEQRGGTLNCSRDGNVVRFTVNLPVEVHAVGVS